MKRFLLVFIVLTLTSSLGIFITHVLAETVTPTVYEAEKGEYSGGARSQYDANASGSYIAAYFGEGASTKITTKGEEGGVYQLSMKYASASANRTMGLYVNNVRMRTLSFAATGGYTIKWRQNILFINF